MSYSLFNRGKYWATPPVLTDGDVSPVALDVNSNVKTKVVSSALPANAAQETGGNLDSIAAGIAAVYVRLLGVVIAAGNAIIGKVGIDQTTPGTTNKVSIGTDGTVQANAGTNLNTSLLAVEAGGNLAAIKADVDKIPSQGQALSAASMPVVLPAAQISTLTPPAAITNFAQESGGNLASAKGDLDTIAGSISGGKQKVSAAAGDVVAEISDGTTVIGTVAHPVQVALPAATVSTLTPPAAITNFANETGGNLAAIKADVDKIPSQGQALAAASMPVVLPATQITTLTPPAAITNFANEAGGNLAAAKGDLDTIAGAVSGGKVKVSAAAGDVVIAGAKTNNNAVPDGTNIGVLPAVANAAAPTLTEGDQVLKSMDLAGNERVTLGGTPVFSQAAVTSKSTGSVASLTAAYGSNVKLGTTLIVACGVGNVTAPTISDTQGNTYIQAVNKASAAHNIAIFYAISKAAGANTVQVNNGGAAASIAMTIYEVPGFLVAAPVDQVASANATSAAPASGFVDPSFPGSYAFGAIGVGTAPQTVTVTTNAVPSPVWSNDSGQQNPITPAGLQSFVAGSAYCGRGLNVQFAGAITSEPWTAVIVVFRPYAIGIQGEIQGTVPNNTSSAAAPNPIVVAGLDATNGLVKALIMANNNVAVTLSGAGSGGLETASGNVVAQIAGGGGVQVPGFMSCGLKSSQAAAAAVIEVFRIPSTFRSAMSADAVSNGLQKVWTPASGKKFRLMRYKIEVGADCSLSAATPVSLSFQDGDFTGFDVGPSHRFVIPATAITTAGELYASEWIDLGNGYLSAVANNPLNFVLDIPLAAAAYTPTFAMTSGQWECAAITFKAKSTARMIQQKSATAAAANVAVTPTIGTQIGNTVVVAVRTTNPAGGAPTITITDAGGNTWNSETIRTNASDTTNGSSLQIFWSTITNPTGAITATATGTVPTQMKILATEWYGITAIDAHNVGTTGNSAAPASGAVTTTVAGDVIIGVAANGGSSNALTAAAGFQIRSSLSDANGTIALVDNTATTSLAAGKGSINVIVCGTEE